MKDVTSHNFGFLIAYLLPGFVLLWGLGHVSPTVESWLAMGLQACEQPTIAGFLYVTVTSLGLGMAVSAIRFVVIDRAYARSGLKRPKWDDAKLQERLHAYQKLIDIHYHYYLFYANTLVSAVLAYAVRRWAVGLTSFPDFSEAVLLIVLPVFWLTARDNLRNYYERVNQLLDQARPV